MQLSPPFSSIQSPGREARAWIGVDVAGGRTVIRRQHVGYPLHVTRGFYLDNGRPDLLTLYLQSASGGLYAGDLLQLDVSVAEGAALCLTTQASTVVHHGKGVGAVQRQSIEVGAGAFCVVVCDPYVLFPGAQLKVKTQASVADDGVLIFIDGLTCHDPAQRGECFASYASSLQVFRPNGQLLLSDVGELFGENMRQPGGPLGGYAATATVTVVGRPSLLPDARALEQRVIETGCFAGASAAPNEAGLVVRILAPGGGELMRGLEVAFHAAAAAAAGVQLARRRK